MSSCESRLPGISWCRPSGRWGIGRLANTSPGDLTMRPNRSRSVFSHFSKAVARATGSPPAFFLALGLIVVWVGTGPLFRFSDTWQLVINTTTTVVTFLMVFLIQGTQNRDAQAVQVKLDELLRATQGAHNALLDLEDLDQGELDSVRRDYARLALEARRKMQTGETDTGMPDVR